MNRSFFWRFWLSRRDRLALAVMGAVVLAAGLSFVSLLSESVLGTVVRTYSQSWRTPYDILVHVPLPGGRPLPDLTEPNVLSTLPAGISTEQLASIRDIEGVDVAAPLAVVGMAELTMPNVVITPDRATPTHESDINVLAPQEPGVYRITATTRYRSAPWPESSTMWSLFGIRDANGRLPDWAPPDLWSVERGKRSAGGSTAYSISASGEVFSLLVGVDPDAEDRLVGLRSAVTLGRYFASQDRPLIERRQDSPRQIEIPVLLNEAAFEGYSMTYRVERLNEQMRPEAVVYTHAFDPAGMRQYIEDVLKHGDPWWASLIGRSGQLTFRPANTPDAGRWPDAVALVPQSPPQMDYRAEGTALTPDGTRRSISGRENVVGGSFRPFESLQRPDGSTALLLTYHIAGLFDATKLGHCASGQSCLPLMTYRPAEGRLVLDARGRPLNPPRVYRGDMSPAGFLTSPPFLVTTLDAAVAINGDRAINAVEVKIADDANVTPETIARAKRIAQEIERRTGLVAEVTMGSSPADVLVKVPASDGHPALGWVEEQWVHLSAPVTAVTQTEFGYSAYIALGILVTAIFAVATGLAGVTARRRELGLAAAVGWPRSYLGGVAAREQLFYAGLVAITATLVAAVGGAGPLRAGLVFLVGIGAYLPAAWASGRAARATDPGAALRWGDLSAGRRVLPGAGTLSLALASLLGRPTRALLTVIAVALPSGLILVLAYVTQHLNGILYTTVTGRYAALQAGPAQYAMGLVALAVASLAAFDVVRQNAADHRPERALLHALGWPRSRIALTMVWEGLLLGLAAGFLGVLAGLGAVAGLYGPGVRAALATAAWVWAVPAALGLVVGVAGAAAEARAWNRTGLAGVGAGEVVRLGRRGALAAGAILAAAAVATLVLTVPRAARQVQQATTAPEQRATNAAVAALRDTVTAQGEAAAKGDLSAFLATIDPSSQPFQMEQRHWLEDLGVWKRVHPGATVTESIRDVTLLGGNTANATIRLEVRDPQHPESDVVSDIDTVWIQAGGRWVEHGLQYDVRAAGGVTVWSSPVVPVEMVERAARTASETLVAFERVFGWTPTDIILELDRANALRPLLGPRLAALRGALPWVEYGEPLRLATDQATIDTANLAGLLGQKMAMDRSHNHAAAWLRDGVGRYAMNVIAGLPLGPYLKDAAARGFADRPDRLAAIDPLAAGETDQQVFADVSTLFTEYLAETYGAATLGRILDALGAAPPDPRMTGPATLKDRSRMTVDAIERVTGKTWSQLNDGYLTWVRSQR